MCTKYVDWLTGVLTGSEYAEKEKSAWTYSRWDGVVAVLQRLVRSHSGEAAYRAKGEAQTLVNHSRLWMPVFSRTWLLRTGGNLGPTRYGKGSSCDME